MQTKLALALGPVEFSAGSACARAVDRFQKHSQDRRRHPIPSPIRAARRHVLGDIGLFLEVHDLPASAYTLAIAHDYITGQDQMLVRAVEAQIRAGDAISLEWLDRAGHGDTRASDQAGLEKLMVKLEASVEDFGKTTTAAKTATSEYNYALKQHMGELEQVSKAGAVINELAQIARAMMERTRVVEQEMTRSELQTRALKRSLDQARKSAELDHLTGLPNRRAFESRLDAEFMAAKERQESLCKAFCDVDHFKVINDTHGHDAGDRVLKVVAQNLARVSNDQCHVARHGGEEFVILLRGKSLLEASELLDELRAEMAERRLVNRATDVPFGKVTFSGGIADVLSHGSPRAALKAADEALYRAKAEGRNRIAVAPRPQAATLPA